MISEFYVECLAKKIINKEINLYTNNPFCLEDIKRGIYRTSKDENRGNGGT